MRCYMKKYKVVFESEFSFSTYFVNADSTAQAISLAYSNLVSRYGIPYAESCSLAVRACEV